MSKNLQLSILKILYKERDNDNYIDLLKTLPNEKQNILYDNTKDLKELNRIEVKDQFVGGFYNIDAVNKAVKTPTNNELLVKITPNGVNYYKTTTSITTKIIKIITSSLIFRIVSGIVVFLVLYYVFGITR